MSREFDGATQNLNGNVSAITDLIVMSAWVKPDANAIQTIMGWWPSSGGFNTVRTIQMGLNGSGNAYMNAAWTDGVSAESGSAVSGNAVTLSEWNHVFGWQYDGALRGVILNGGTEVTDTTSVTSALLNQHWIGAHKNGPSFWFDGCICEAITWDLEPADFNAIVTQDWGASIYNNRQQTPWLFPSQLKCYLPLKRDEDRIWWGVSGGSLGSTGGPTIGDDPILNPPWARYHRGEMFRPRVQLNGRDQLEGSIQFG